MLDDSFDFTIPDGWSFGATRYVWDELGSTDRPGSAGDFSLQSEEQLVALLCVPLCVDLALLPVTLPRDLLVHGIP